MNCMSKYRIYSQQLGFGQNVSERNEGEDKQYTTSTKLTHYNNPKNLITKSIIYSIASVMLAGSNVVFSSEPTEGWYAGFMLGISDQHSIKYTIDDPDFSTTIPGRLSYKIGGNLAGQLGYRCNKFRYEAEVYGNANPFRKITVQNFTFNNTAAGGSATQAVDTYKIAGHTDLFAGFLNAYYEIYDENYAKTKFVPYLGLGIGYAHVREHNTLTLYSNNLSLNITNTSASQNVPIGQGILGINYFFNNNISLGTDLRYMSTKKVKNLNSRVEAGSWNLLMNFSFD